MDEKQKKALIDGLITNSCCWEEEDREPLNALGDDKLKRLKVEADKTQELVTTNGVAVKEAEEKLSKVPGIAVWNEETKVWDVKEKEEVVKNAEDKKKAEEQAAIANKALDKYKAEIAPQLKFAESEMTRQKAELADRLVENVADNAAKVAHRERLMTRSLEDLRQDVSLLPQRVETQTAASYAGAAGGAQTMAANAEKNFEPFGLPEDYVPKDED